MVGPVLLGNPDNPKVVNSDNFLTTHWQPLTTLCSSLCLVAFLGGGIQNSIDPHSSTCILLADPSVFFYFLFPFCPCLIRISNGIALYGNYGRQLYYVMKQLDVDVSPPAYIMTFRLTLTHVTLDLESMWHELLSRSFCLVTDDQTDGKWCIWAHRAVCTGGLKNWGK